MFVYFFIGGFVGLVFMVLEYEEGLGFFFKFFVFGKRKFGRFGIFIFVYEFCFLVLGFDIVVVILFLGVLSDFKLFVLIRVLFWEWE